MAITILTETNLDVTCKQRELVQEALGQDGVYIRTKEVLLDLYSDSSISSIDKAKIIAETLANMSVSITASAMSTGLQWASQEKELALKKLQLQYELDNLDVQNAILENQKETALADKQLKQAQRIREYGIAIFDAEGNVLSLGDNGKIFKEQEAIEQDTANKGLLSSQIVSQTEEVQARTHKLVADTYVNHGIYTWSNISDTGITGVTKTGTGYVTLSDMNKQVAAEQAKGYAWNSWANAASSGSSMIGTLVAAEIPNLDPTQYLDIWKSSVAKLNAVVEADVTY